MIVLNERTYKPIYKHCNLISKKVMFQGLNCQVHADYDFGILLTEGICIFISLHIFKD